MKKIFPAFLIICVAVAHLQAQSVDYNKIILPDDAKNVTFEERLVQLAWKNNPASHIAETEVYQTVEESKVAGNQWSSMVGVTGNLNEFNVKDLTSSNTGNANGGNVFFPRYNFFVQLPLSLVLQTPHIKKAAKAKVVASEDRVKLLKLELRTRVLKLYSDYKMTELIFLVRKQTTADEESNYLLVEQKFKNGDALLEDYLKVQKNRNDVKIQLATAENQFQKAKLDMEEVIGVKMEDVR